MDGGIGHCEMSAASQAGGLAESQDTMTETRTMEDPGRHWIDLVLAFKSGDPLKVREVLAQAKVSHWTHEMYSEACQGDPGYSEDGSGPDEGWDSADDFAEE